MARKDKAERNEYQKQLMRERRAREKRGQPPSATKASAKTEAVRSVTTKRTVYEGPLDLVQRLEDLDTRSLSMAEKMLELAEEALNGIVPETLAILDVKRLVELGIKLRDKSAVSLEKQEEKTETAIFATEQVIGNPEFLQAAHTMLTLSAHDDLARFVDGSAASPADSSILRAIHVETGVDPLSPSTSPR